MWRSGNISFVAASADEKVGDVGQSVPGCGVIDHARWARALPDDGAGVAFEAELERRRGWFAEIRHVDGWKHVGVGIGVDRRLSMLILMGGGRGLNMFWVLLRWVLV